MKFAIGPAATIAARRRPTCRRSSAPLRRRHHRAIALVRHARGILIAEELHVAAERNGRQFPARAVAVVEAEQFGAEADRKHQNPDAAKRATRK